MEIYPQGYHLQRGVLHVKKIHVTFERFSLKGT